MSDLISREDAIEAFGLSEKTRKYGGDHSGYDTMLKYEIQDVLENLPSAYTLPIHEDGTLEVKVPNAHKVGRVLVKDVDSHIGGGLFYQDDAEAEWIPCSEGLPSDSGNYLITVADLRLGHNGEHTVTMADFYAKAKKWNSVVEVIAWKPLPTPYKGTEVEE